MEWSQAFVAGLSPAARSRHSCTLVESKLIVLGGGDDTRVYNDLYVLDTGLFYFFFILFQSLFVYNFYLHLFSFKYLLFLNF